MGFRLDYAGQHVGLPRGKLPQFLGVLHGVKEGQHLPQLVGAVGRDAFGVVVLV
jgi:hypothetical protein